MSKPWVRQPCRCFATWQGDGWRVVSVNGRCSEHKQGDFIPWESPEPPQEPASDMETPT